MIEKFIEFNKKFVEEKGYEKYRTTKYPDKKVSIHESMATFLSGYFVVRYFS